MMKMVKAFSFESNSNQWNQYRDDDDDDDDVDRLFTCNFGLTREKKRERERIYGMQISFVELKSIESAFERVLRKATGKTILLLLLFFSWSTTIFIHVTFMLTWLSPIC